ncbi:MAG: hypothetical protein ABIH25_05695 [Candidatus Woesearchaeota archaeon]
MKEWSKELGIRICPFRKKRKGHKNFPAECIDVQDSLIINMDSKYYNEYLKIKTIYDLVCFLEEIIGKEFDGDDGYYWIGGRFSDYKHQELWNCSVILINFQDGRAYEISKRNWRKKQYRAYKVLRND